MEFRDKIKNIDCNKPYKSMFLSLEEQAQLKNRYKKEISFTGGYDNPERVRAYTLKKPLLSCFKITYPEKYLHISHQNILGSLLALNVKRESIGDILADEQCFFVIGELEDLFINDFNKIGNHPITLQKIDGSDLVRTIHMEEQSTTMDSLRLDLVVSKITNKSRNDALFMLENDYIKINHLVTNKHTKLVKENDVLSIRRFGRFMILDTSKTSKKGKIVVKYGKYV